MPTYSGEHEVADGDEILGDKQICSQYDKIEADKEEDRRRQRFPHLVQKLGADPTCNPVRNPGRLGHFPLFVFRKPARSPISCLSGPTERRLRWPQKDSAPVSGAVSSQV